MKKQGPATRDQGPGHPKRHILISERQYFILLYIFASLYRFNKLPFYIDRVSSTQNESICISNIVGILPSSGRHVTSHKSRVLLSKKKSYKSRICNMLEFLLKKKFKINEIMDLFRFGFWGLRPLN